MREQRRRQLDARDVIHFAGTPFAPRRVKQPKLARHYSDEFIGALAHQYVERASATRRPVTMEDFEDVCELAFNSLSDNTGICAERTAPTHPGTDIVLRRRDKPRREVGRISLKGSAPSVQGGNGRLFRIHNFVRWGKPVHDVDDLHQVFAKLAQHRDYHDLLVLRTTRTLEMYKNNFQPVIYPTSSQERWRESAWHVQLLSIPTSYFDNLSERLDAGDLDVRFAKSGSGRVTVRLHHNDEVGTPFWMVVDPYSKQLFLNHVDQFACRELGAFYVPAMDQLDSADSPVKQSSRPTLRTR